MSRCRACAVDEYGVTDGTPQRPTLFDGHYLRNRSTLDIGVLGYIGIVQHKEHSPEVLSIPPGTPCVYIYTHTYTQRYYDAELFRQFICKLESKERNTISDYSHDKLLFKM